MVNPLVSICIPTYNGEQFIAEAMNSAIGQTYANLEIVVSDDSSNDKTIAIIESFRSKTPIPIHIYYHSPKGIGANWNNSIRKANGTYIKFLFQDDVLLPDCVEYMVQVLQDYPKIGLVASKREFIMSHETITDELKQWMLKYKDNEIQLNLKKEGEINIMTKDIFKSNVFFDSPRNKVGEPSVFLFRKQIVTDVGYFREDLKQILDYEFCYRILKKYSIGIIQKPLVKFRLHPNQTTIKNMGNDEMDYKIYDGIMYKEFFWLLNFKTKIYYLKKFNPWFKLLINKLNRIF